MTKTVDYYVGYFDGMCEPCNPKGNMGIGAFILNKDREQIFTLSKYIKAPELDYKTSNNVAEYMGVISIMEFLSGKDLLKEHIIICGDSKLVICQMNGEWKCNGGIYEPYYHAAREIRNTFADIEFKWIPRTQNEKCDQLSKRAAIAGGCIFKIQPL